MIHVFVDTSVTRMADRQRTTFVGRTQTVQWGPTKQDIVVHQPETTFPLDKLNNEKHEETYADALLIAVIEELAKEKLVTLCWHFETHWEYLRHRKLGLSTPPILDLIKKANCPIYYGRLIASPFTKQDEQFEFLRGLKHPEYEKWKNLVGARPNTANERNQLMDAWHLWSGDHNHCQYFLTMDYNLINSVRSRKHDSTMRVVAPFQFLAEFRILERPAKLERETWERIQKGQVGVRAGALRWLVKIVSRISERVATVSRRFPSLLR